MHLLICSFIWEVYASLASAPAPLPAQLWCKIISNLFGHNIHLLVAVPFIVPPVSTRTHVHTPFWSSWPTKAPPLEALSFALHFRTYFQFPKDTIFYHSPDFAIPSYSAICLLFKNSLIVAISCVLCRVFAHLFFFSFTPHISLVE